MSGEISLEDDMVERIGQRVRKHRKEEGLSQTQLGAQAGTSQGAISRLESGKQAPGLAKLERISQALGVEVSDLLEESESGNSEDRGDMGDLLGEDSS